MLGRTVKVTVFNNVRQKTFLSQDFRIRFDVRHRLASTKGTVGKIEIFNLNATTEGDLLAPSIRCIVEAGYGIKTGLIFDGYIMRAQRGRQGVDRYMTLHLRSAILLEQTISLALGGKNSVRSVIRSIVRAMKEDVRFASINLDEPSLSVIPAGVYLTNWSWTGPARLALDQLLLGVGLVEGLDGLTYRLDWTVKDNTIYILTTDADLGPYADQDPVNKPIDETVFSVSEDVGILDVPEQLEHGIRVRILLNAGIRVDQLMKVTAKTRAFRDERTPPFYVDQQWRTVDVRHNGDSWQGQYFTEIEARELG